MIAFAKRNIKLFFRDRSAVFFSLLAVLIIIGLYALFLGDVWTENFAHIANARQIMDAWIMAGLIAVTSVTSTMGAFGILVDDRTKKIEKDFAASPIPKASLAGGYILSAFTVGVIMSVVALVLAQGYLLLGGGAMLSALAYLKLFGLIVLTTLANTAMVLSLIHIYIINGGGILHILFIQGFFTLEYAAVDRHADGLVRGVLGNGDRCA